MLKRKILKLSNEMSSIVVARAGRGWWVIISLHLSRPLTLFPFFFVVIDRYICMQLLAVGLIVVRVF